MQELEKLLEEIDSIEKIQFSSFSEPLIAIKDVKKIIQKHMDDVDADDNGWVAISDRLPTMEEYQRDDGRFILDDGNGRYQVWFDIYDRKFKYYDFLFETTCVDKDAIAWHPLPSSYHPGKEN